MTRRSSKILCLLFCFMVFISYSAIAGVKGGKHDFSTNNLTPRFGAYFDGNPSGSMPITEVCVFCHTPHGASKQSLYSSATSSSTFLWNRRLPVATSYTLYSSSTLTMITLQQPTGVSLMCLSCHDGVTSIGVDSGGGQSLLNNPGSGNYDIATINPPDYIGQAPGFVFNIGDLLPLGTVGNLSNDHPVSFAWVSDVPGIKLDSQIFGVTALKLYGGRMECSTCHDVHDNESFPPFLRMTNENSDMCLACHNK